MITAHQFWHHRRVTPEVATAGVPAQNQYAPQPGHVGKNGAWIIDIAQGKVGKPPGQGQAVLRPFVWAFGQSVCLGGLLNQRLGGIVQVNRDSWHGVTSVAVRTNYMPQRICTGRDSAPRLWPFSALRHNAPAPAGRCV